MMSLRAVHAGAGYQYLLRSVATNDSYDESVDEKRRLGDYYQAKGTPPGQWLGSGLKGFESENIHVGARVEALQMAALYGDGLHPDSYERLKNDGKLADVLIGNRFITYTHYADSNGNPIPKEDNVLIALAEVENNYILENNRLPDDTVRDEWALTIGREFYERTHGGKSASGKDIISWINKLKTKARQPVAGFDLTFSPVKSVSILWALADEETSRKISRLHDEAVKETLGWAEDNIIRTRVGHGGLHQVKTQGLIASAFKHFDTRTGDPDLHTHVLVANKVQGEDGKWRSLDGRTIFANAVNMSDRYNAILQHKLERELGVAFREKSMGENKQPVYEVDAISDSLINHFSKRRNGAREVYNQLVEQYTNKYHRAPSQQTVQKLWQAAILQTRDAKKPAESLAQLRDNWRRELSTEGVEHYLSEVATALNQTDKRPFFLTDDDGANAISIELAARATVDAITSRRSDIRLHHIQAGVSATLKGYRFNSDEEFNRAHSQVCQFITDNLVVKLNPTEPLSLPSELTDDEGQAIDYTLGSIRYTTTEIIEAERNVLDACFEPTGYVVEDSIIDDALAAHEKENGWALNAGQQELARHLLTTGTLVATGVGAAGTGKTTSMQLVTNVWKSTGHNVVALAPSAAAAEILGTEIGVDAHTIDKLTFVWRGDHPTKKGHDPSALPVKLKPGDMLLVDEAGMATTKNMCHLLEIAQATGAVIRFIGDPFQLDAVDRGGLFGALTDQAPTAELLDVMRFSKGKDTAQAEASLAIRRGEADTAVTFYQSRGWLDGGTREEMLTQAVTAYLDDVKDGFTSLVIAPTNKDVDTLNEIIRSSRISDGVVDTSQEIALAHGDTAGVGDTIILRQNTVLGTGQRVLNGEIATIEQIGTDGSLKIRSKRSGHITLPAEYVREHTHLGYAATVHRSQGATVDTCHAVIDGSMDKAATYVALTRGKRVNHAYAVQELRLDETAEQAHMHMAGDDEAPTPAQVLTGCINRDTRQKAAITSLLEVTEHAHSRDRLTQLYKYGCDLIVDSAAERILPAYVDRLNLDSDGADTVKTHLKYALQQGIDPVKLFEQFAGDMAGADNPALVCVARIDKHLIERGLMGAGEDTDGQPASRLPKPPTDPTASPQLTEWLEETYMTLTAPPEPEPTEETAEERLARQYAEYLAAGYGTDANVSTLSELDKDAFGSRSTVNGEGRATRSTESTGGNHVVRKDKDRPKHGRR